MIRAVGYNQKTATLKVVFTSGKTYTYEEVPKEVYDALLASESKGRFMRDRIIGEYAEYLGHRRR
ncbi:KTSC domain-containing protein [Rubidibacter lacunae]|nr:KTSC domain-containing protein [Rubidibacter lacunae]